LYSQGWRVLTDVKLRSLKAGPKVYRVADAAGLCIEVKPSGSKLWRYRFRIHGKPSMVSLGEWPAVSLAEARQRLQTVRRQVSDGVDPAAHRQVTKANAATAAANTFLAVFEEWISRRARVLTPSTVKVIRHQLTKLLSARFQARPVGEITAAELLAELRPIEHAGKIETAHKVKQRASAVFRYAIATGRAERDPAQDLKGALSPSVTVSHAAVTDPTRLGELLRLIDGYTGSPLTTTALRLMPYLFPRTLNLRMMEWKEIDWDAKQWRIPGTKMKMRDEHISPLPTQALELLELLRPITGTGRYVFPNQRAPKAPMAANTLNSALRNLGVPSGEATNHGFRATASTLLNEMGYRSEVIERQLAHVERRKEKRAYNRALYLDERASMMQAWADYLDGLRIAPEKVVPIRKPKAQKHA